MNGGSYVVCVAHEQHVEWAAREEPERPMYIDAEDPTRSSWARYINHADSGDSASCNCELRVVAEPEALAEPEAKQGGGDAHAPEPARPKRANSPPARGGLAGYFLLLASIVALTAHASLSTLQPPPVPPACKWSWNLKGPKPWAKPTAGCVPANAFTLACSLRVPSPDDPRVCVGKR